MSLENKSSTIQQVVAVVGGKGGVGKSTITGLLAVAMQRRGLRVGILDGDLYGPGIVHIFGASSEFSMTDDGQTEPLRSKNGIAMMGINVFLENVTDPITWRGPMAASAFRQFYNDVAWGQLDCLLIDMPTGTADIPVTALEFLPLTGVILVSTPQLLATTILKKSISMVEQNQSRIIGVVENMAYLALPGQEVREIFGASHYNDLAAMINVPLLGRIPLDPRLSTLCDTGEIEQYDGEPVNSMATSVLSALDIKVPSHS
ncbi:MAG: P-loop NTPase [Ktedonobacteraceae bacterium]